MKERNKVYKVVKSIEQHFPGCVAWAHFDGNAPMTYTYWTVCVNDYELYYSDEYKKLTKELREKYNDVRFLFCYCNPLESKLAELAEKDNLIMNI